MRLTVWIMQYRPGSTLGIAVIAVGFTYVWRGVYQPSEPTLLSEPAVSLFLHPSQSLDKHL